MKRFSMTHSLALMCAVVGVTAILDACNRRNEPQVPFTNPATTPRPTTTSRASPDTQPSGHPVVFYGIKDRSDRIVYLIDASGSLIDTMPFVLAELRRSIAQLHSSQQFAVLFYQRADVIELPPKGMKIADKANRETASDWLYPNDEHVLTSGSGNCATAMKQAATYAPEVIYLLSDNVNGNGKYEIERGKLLEDMKSLNTSRARINTIQFLYPDSLEAAGHKATLQIIAEQSGGQYHFVDGKELGIQ